MYIHEHIHIFRIFKSYRYSNIFASDNTNIAAGVYLCYLCVCVLFKGGVRGMVSFPAVRGL